MTSDMNEDDHIRVSYETVARKGNYPGYELQGCGQVWNFLIKVIEPADVQDQPKGDPVCDKCGSRIVDDPSKDEFGTVRQSPRGALAARAEPDETRPERYGRSPLTGTLWDFDEVVGWPIIGAVPGTPAAEAQESKMRYFSLGRGGRPSWRYDSTRDVVEFCLFGKWRPSQEYKTLADLREAGWLREVQGE